ncbi:MAG: hypothetical protein ACRD3E_20645, partial [Terriglobales bacterium]
PWLIEGRAPAEVIRENIQLTTDAMKVRLGISPAGFRTPGGFPNGLSDRPDVRQMLLHMGFTWVSALYPLRIWGVAGRQPGPSALHNIILAQQHAQPFRYNDGLMEVPMSPISDIDTFRNMRWKRDWFVGAVRAATRWAIENHAVFDYLSHPGCLYSMDPHFEAIDAICEEVRNAADRAEIVNLDTIARRSLA